MYNNRPNQKFTKRTDDIINDEKFLLADKQPTLKTVTSKDGQTRDLCEFWVLDNGEEVQCVVWNDLAERFNAEFNLDDFKSVIISYRKNLNSFNGKMRYSVRQFSFTN
ncbi:hypothetical protein D6D54_07205 [Spiroplasma poulsonii]|uniref:Single-stranded DNA-binding protein n=1 Tax=Spiroplasma poulsonii TaxID=2138 RepID=A0A3S0ZVG3_9MOLU|nr:OB-fold nucleic acid binding domain-containing protein [Spiroplasma poulsonii]MBW3058842.1 hypothetical protein [Spiroplasma poulsonii]RUP75949.1 hypothetical protein D6D54_07205 [Spiroplasma poulsonii]